MLVHRIRIGLGLLLGTLAGCPADEPELCSTSAALGTGTCQGNAASCSSLSAISCNQEGCTVDIGDYDDPYDDRCEGRSDECSEMDTETQCSYQVGCSWDGDSASTSSGSGTSTQNCNDNSSNGGSGVPGPGSGGSTVGSGGGTPGTGGGSPGTGGAGPATGGGSPGSGGSMPPGSGGNTPAP